MSNNIPKHIGIILDGNRRWARAQGLPTLSGHRAGLDNVRRIARLAFKRGVHIVTVFAFSTENWKRDAKEVRYLLGLFRRFVKKEAAALGREGVKVKFLGRLGDFSPEVRQEMRDAEKATAKGKAGQCNVCLSYGGRDEIVRAVRKITASGKKGKEITEELISSNLDTAGLPDPDLIIRTSGELRLSGFLAWQAVYSELYFEPKYWPDYGEKDLDKALSAYTKRRRRFGAN